MSTCVRVNWGGTKVPPGTPSSYLLVGNQGSPWNPSFLDWNILWKKVLLKSSMKTVEIGFLEFLSLITCERTILLLEITRTLICVWYEPLCL